MLCPDCMENDEVSEVFFRTLKKEDATIHNALLEEVTAPSHPPPPPTE